MRKQIAVVTGGSSGIGREIVRCLAKNGYDIGFNYLSNEESSHILKKEIESMGRSCFVSKMNVSCNKSVSLFFDELESYFDQDVDLLVNNAGIVQDGLIATLSEEDIRSVIDTNLIGSFFCIQKVIPGMFKKRGGSIVNITSVAAQKPGRGQSNYAAAKGGLEALTRALAVEFSPRNIRVNAIAPGVIETQMSKTLVSSYSEEINSKLLIKRYGFPNDIAEGVLYLANPNGYITGEVLSINGGLKMI